MSELMNEKLKSYVGKKVLIFLINSFRYEGKIIDCDDEYVEILDIKTASIKFIRLTDIKELELR